MAEKKSQTQVYKVLLSENNFEIRHYPSAVIAIVFSKIKSYRKLGYYGFRKLANYIFGGNSEKKQIAMTAPVQMTVGESVSTMSFLMPSNYKIEDLPKPNSSEIQIQRTESEYVAVLQFGGFITTGSICRHKVELEKLLQKIGVAHSGNFRYWGYNPPYQLFGRRNELIVRIDPEKLQREFLINN